MSLGTAVVGCGMLATSTHLPTLQASDNFTLRVCCDIDPDTAARAKERFGASRACTDWREVVDAADVDLVVLCTHTELRAELICAALAAGKGVYTEKPLADSRAEMAAIQATVDETGGAVCVGHNRRSAPGVAEFRRLVQKARVQGADRRLWLDRNTGKRPHLPEEDQLQLLIRVNDDIRTWKLWIFDDEAGIILAEMVHFIDLALWLNNAPPVSVFAMGSPRGNFTELIRFADGSIATLQHSMVGNFDYPKELFEATARNVSIALDHHVELRQRGLEDEPFRQNFNLWSGPDGKLTGIAAFHAWAEATRTAALAGGPAPLGVLSKGHADHLEAFGAHLRGEGSNPCPVESAILVTDIALSLAESCRTGKVVDLRDH